MCCVFYATRLHSGYGYAVQAVAVSTSLGTLNDVDDDLAGGTIFVGGDHFDSFFRLDPEMNLTGRFTAGSYAKAQRAIRLST